MVIDVPPVLNMADAASMQILTKYLYKLTDQLNAALANIETSNNRQTETLTNVSETALKLAELLDKNELAKTGDVRKQYQALRDTLISQVDSVIATLQTQLDVLNNSIRSYVAENYLAADNDMRLEEKISSMVQQTADQIQMEFARFATIDVDSVNDLTVNFKTYIRFNENGIEIGKVGDGASPIVTRITNTRMEFAIAGTDVVVAYISNDKLHISMAEIDRLSVGNNAVGYVDFDMTPDGLFVRWRS